MNPSIIAKFVIERKNKKKKKKKKKKQYFSIALRRSQESWPFYVRVHF